MKSNAYTRPVISYKKNRVGKTVPNQAMSIKEIVRRFVRGIPADVIQRNPVYVDQSEHDLEQISRMEFGDKAAMAEELSAKMRDMEQQVKDEREKRAKSAQAAKDSKQKGAKQDAGIDDLDNTMPVDTGTESQ